MYCNRSNHHTFAILEIRVLVVHRLEKFRPCKFHTKPSFSGLTGKICKIIGHQFHKQEKELRLRNFNKFRR
jgi:hypothetical protein